MLFLSSYVGDKSENSKGLVKVSSRAPMIGVKLPVKLPVVFMDTTVGGAHAVG
jgi:hypothetical protein